MFEGVRRGIAAVSVYEQREVSVRAIDVMTDRVKCDLRADRGMVHVKARSDGLL
jgi:hypothetical protein